MKTRTTGLVKCDYMFYLNSSISCSNSFKNRRPSNLPASFLKTIPKCLRHCNASKPQQHHSVNEMLMLPSLNTHQSNQKGKNNICSTGTSDVRSSTHIALCRSPTPTLQLFQFSQITINVYMFVSMSCPAQCLCLCQSFMENNKTQHTYTH